MSKEDEITEAMMLEQYLRELRALRSEMNQYFDEMLDDLKRISRNLDFLHQHLSNTDESQKEIPEELVN